MGRERGGDEQRRPSERDGAARRARTENDRVRRGQKVRENDTLGTGTGICGVSVRESVPSSSRSYW